MRNMAQFPRLESTSDSEDNRPLARPGSSYRTDNKKSAASSRHHSPTKAPRVAAATADEETPLLASAHGDDDARNGSAGHQNPLTRTVMAILLIGELMSHADTTLIFAAAPHIASELCSLRGIGWLATAYTLGVCSMQPLYGRLSDIFGRKQMLLFAYFVLSVGCVFCALSRNLTQMIISRAVSGIGGAGVMTMASVIITDSVPHIEFAKYRSYINLATTLGRSIGGPIGGLVADKCGWQWLFWGRLPLFFLSIALIIASLKSPSLKEEVGDGNGEASCDDKSFREKWKMVDVKGALMLTKTIVSLILFLGSIESGPMTPSFWLLMASVIVFGHFFVLIELFATTSPIFNIRILGKRNVALSYLVDYLQVFAQVSIMFSVPLYFQVTQRASALSSGARIVPAVVANTIGALMSGKLVQITHRHKLILIGTGIIGASSYALILARWNGDTSFGESLYIIGGGFATGIAQSASFVTMASHLERKEVAMATGGFFLVSSLGTVTAVTTTNVLLQTLFRKGLGHINVPNQADFIDRMTSDIGNIAKLTGTLRHLVVEAFVRALKSTYVSGVVTCLLSAALAGFIRDLSAEDVF